MRPGKRRARDRGMALFIVLAVVVLLAAVVATAVGWSKNDRLNAGKNVHNMTVQDATESTLQYGRAYFAQPATSALWNTYLAYFVTTRTFTQVQADHPELIPNLPANAGFNCFIFARDDVDEPAGQFNTSADNNLRIFVGATCTQQGGTLQSELVSPLEYNPPPTAIGGSSQFSSGALGNNNTSVVSKYR